MSNVVFHTIHHRRRIVKNHFQSIITTIPKHVEEVHKNKKTDIVEIKAPTHHVMFEFANPIINNESPPGDEELDQVEYIVEIPDVYEQNLEKEMLDYNPMFFSLRHYISSKN
jgi:hypothetical protein